MYVPYIYPFELMTRRSLIFLPRQGTNSGIQLVEVSTATRHYVYYTSQAPNDHRFPCLSVTHFARLDRAVNAAMLPLTRENELFRRGIARVTERRLPEKITSVDIAHRQFTSIDYYSDSHTRTYGHSFSLSLLTRQKCTSFMQE